MRLFLTTALALAVAAPGLALGGEDMSNMQGMAQSSMTTADAAGVVKAVDPKAGTVTIQHGPIAGLKWPAMTMAFKATSPSLLRGVAVGEAVKFKLMKMGGAVQLTAIRPN